MQKFSTSIFSDWSGNPNSIFCCNLFGSAMLIKFSLVKLYHQLLKDTQKRFTLSHKRKKCWIVSDPLLQNKHILELVIFIFESHCLHVIVLCISLN